MDNRSVLLKLSILAVLIFLVSLDQANAGGGHQKKKKIVIHVPVHKKIEKHVHTIIKHVHHHHKPIVLKEEKKIIHEDHRPIEIHHQTKEHIHHHEKHDHEHHSHHDHHEHHEHHHPVVEHKIPLPIEQEEEHIHHHHNYEHKDGFIGGHSDGIGSSEEH